MEQFSNLNSNLYLGKVSAVAKLSPLFSDSAIPFIHSRFAERLFCLISGARDLARQDISFDAIDEKNAGVGVKTFVASSISTSKVEKIAEFTNFATKGRFSSLAGEALAHEVSLLRNKRVLSDCAEFGIDLSASYYHCLVRTPQRISFIEQEFGLISTSNLQPTDRRGIITKEFASSGHVYFTDGVFDFVFNVAKNVLYRRFTPALGFTSEEATVENLISLQDLIANLELMDSPELVAGASKAYDPVSDFVILPLYSPSRGAVPEASQINQWNAGGRARVFGEGYISVPRDVHTLRPGFFPHRDKNFMLKLPNGKVVKAKICQAGDKALMSDPNSALLEWLYATIDGSLAAAEERKGTVARPYTYGDLLQIGKDSVKVSKSHSEEWDYELETAPTGSYENFIQGED